MWCWKQLGRVVVLIMVFGLAVFICSQYYDCWVEENNSFHRWTLGLSLLLLFWPLSYFFVIAIARYHFYREIPPVPPFPPEPPPGSSSEPSSV